MLKAKLSERATQVRFFKFLLVGGLATAVQLAALTLLRSRLVTTLAFSLSYACSTVTHYTLNRWWALPSSRTDSSRQLAEYLLTVVLSYLVNLGVFRILYTGMGLGVMWAAFLAIPPSTLLVFFLLNYRVFRR